MSANSSSAANVSLPASIDSAMLRPWRGRMAWWFPLICCVVSILATTFFVERLRREAWRAAEYDLGIVAGIAADEAASVFGRTGSANSEVELQSNQFLSGLSQRILRLTGKQVVWIDPRSNQLVSSEQPGFGESVRPALATILASPAGSVFTVLATDEVAPLMVVTHGLSSPHPEALIVAVMAPESEMLAPFYRLRRDAVMACLGFILMVWILAWVLSRHLLRPEAVEAAMLRVKNTFNAERMHLSETHRIAQLGHFYWNLATDALDLHGDSNSLYGYIPSQYFRTMHEWQEKFCPADDREAVAANRKSHIEKGEAYTVQRRIFTPAGELRWLDVSAEPVRDESGNMIAYRGVFRDITAQKTAELKLKESEEKFRLISENMHEQVVLLATDGTLLYASPSTATLLGYDAESSIGKSPYKNVHPQDIARIRSAVDTLVATTGTPLIVIEYRYRHRDGHHLCLESQVTPVQALDGSLLHMQIVSRDVSARREAEIEVEKKTRELANANKLLAAEVRERQELEREILTAIELELAQVGLELHDELGQDLTGIALLTKSLERRLIEKGLSDAADATRILELVNHTIGHTRMISHGLSPYIWGTDGLVAALAQLASDTSSLGVVECETLLEGNVCIDDEVVARSLYRIAQESINNALKHSGAQRLTLSLTNLNEGVELTIKDNGIGHADPIDRGGVRGRFHSIRHRCSAIGAELTVRPGEQGGTVVTVVWQVCTSFPAAQSQVEGALQ